ncbi:response regulator transcription factor [Adlercreutzia aquisgranensis]|uniref:response regulator transcription factor n=1 Tax=Adlercreutzia aquisgranensis TaxID=2941323 RepID=UPI00203F86FE|nr:LuxR C-terminal-related transcriptional regulator [Adlercreutzia aquisgranensis]
MASLDRFFEWLLWQSVQVAGFSLLVAAAYKLTPRESEVVVLLAYGRTLAIIARDLQIAKGTARTHIESIYRKLGVHKQQELIDLVEGFQA